MIASEYGDSEVVLRFCKQRPFALCAGETIDLPRFASDLKHLKDKLEKSSGEVLIACKGRYAFSLALLASWMLGRRAILPPSLHSRSLDHIRRRHRLTTYVDDDFLEALDAPVEVFDEPYLELSFALQLEAVVIYTSGSSGDPKAVNKTIANLFSEAFTLQSELPACVAPLVASVPPNHLYGLTFSVILPWVLGVAVVDECPLHATEVLDSMQQVKAELLVTVPVHLRAMLDQEMSCAPKWVIASAGRLDEALAKQWYERFGYEIIEVYGSSETGVIAQRKQLNDRLWQAFAPVKLEHKESCLQVCSPFIHASEGIYFQTEDRVTLQAGGFELHGRADSIVKIAGKRVSLAAIEKVIKACDGIVDAAVVAVPVQGHIRDMAIWAVVVCDTEPCMRVRDIRSILQVELDGIEIPRKMIVTRCLPRESNGKLRRSVLLDMFEGSA
ncbi:MAG: class I adenylate-forming enzyme family protein [Mariprofundaceae bacterium]